MRAFLAALALVVIGCGEVMAMPAPGGAEMISFEADAGASVGAPADAAVDAATATLRTADAGTCAAPLEHTNGVGQSYKSCAVLNARDIDTAILACLAYVADDPRAHCERVGAPYECAGRAIVALEHTSSFTATWAYGGATAGRVRKVQSGQGCPIADSPTWD